jgi:FtsZ-binding cell division protein ZapB
LQLQEENRALTQRAEEAEQAREQINQSNNILQQQLQQQMVC